MPSPEPTLPPIWVVLPDGQEVRGQLHCRKQWPLGGWMYWVGLPMWSNVSESEGVDAAEYRVWLTVDQVRPVRGVSYETVPTEPLRRESPTALAADRWAWKIQRNKPMAGRPTIVVHVWDCPEAPAAADELDVNAALDSLQLPGAVACTECEADVALKPLL